ncbi:MAG TPA: YbjN domain-containing protein [Haliangiales bacterium]|nr:YbjN domain-containing protein [Haliangiales bacterium]
MPPTRITGFADMVELLAADGVTHVKNETEQMVQIPTELGPFKGNLFIRWDRTLPYVNAICPVVFQIPEERMAEVERACMRINHAIALPGFCVEPEQRFAYFRLTVPIEPGGMEASFYRLMMMAAVHNARDFFVALKGVVDGAPGEEALAVAAQQANATAAAAAGSAFEE